MSQEIRIKLELEVTDCPTCGVVFAVPRSMLERRRQDGGSFHCPSGCAIHFPAGRQYRKENELLSKELTKAQVELAKVRGELLEARHRQEQAEARAAEFAPVEPEHVCEACGAAFRSQSWLTRHMREEHGGQPAALWDAAAE